MSTYKNLWRPNYEGQIALLWLFTAAASWSVSARWALYEPSLRWLAGVSLCIALLWAPKAVSGWRRRARLRGRSLTFLAQDRLAARIKRRPGMLWMGWGFEWTRRHAQLAYDFINNAPPGYAPRRPDRIGAPWIHGLDARERAQMVPLEHIEGHLLVVGTTGSGKTRLLDLLITQAVLRGEAVVIIDPKGDQDLRRSAQNACALCGTPERFVYFHPAFPAESVRIDPLQSFNRPTELASRIATLVPGETGNDPFAAYDQMVMSSIVQGLLSIEARPSLIALRRYVEGGVEQLVERVFDRYFRDTVPGWAESAQQFMARARATKANELIRFYREKVAEERPSTVLEGLANLYEHDRVHFSKMVASLTPILNMLTSGDLGPLLSHDAGDKPDRRRQTHLGECIERHEVVYIGLDALSDSMVAHAIGSILVADLAAVAGDRYNHKPDAAPVNLYIDEAAEVVNDPFIQLLNKGRGAGLRLTIATQSFADFSARMGSRDKARQVLANCNNLVALRVLDDETQKYIIDNLPKTTVKTIMRTHGTTSQPHNPMRYTGNIGQRLIEQEADLFPGALLGEIPNLEYLAKVSGGHIIKGRIPILGALKKRQQPSATPLGRAKAAKANMGHGHTKEAA